MDQFQRAGGAEFFLATNHYKIFNKYTENTENCFENLEFLITPVGQDMVDENVA